MSLRSISWVVGMILAVAALVAVLVYANAQQ